MYPASALWIPSLAETAPHTQPDQFSSPGQAGQPGQPDSSFGLPLCVFINFAPGFFWDWGSKRLFGSTQTMPCLHQSLCRAMCRFVCDRVHRLQAESRTTSKREMPAWNSAKGLFRAIELKTKLPPYLKALAALNPLPGSLVIWCPNLSQARHLQSKEVPDSLGAVAPWECREEACLSTRQSMAMHDNRNSWCGKAN